MNSLLYYYNNVQKMAAYRQAKRMQRGALTAQGGFSTTDPALLQTPFTIQCVIRPTKVTSTLQVAFNTKGNSTNPRIDLNKSGDIVIYGGGSILYTKPANLDNLYDIVFVATDSQLSLFVDGTLITSVPYTNTISLYNIGFYFANNSLYFQGEYLLHRHFSYAMSADEVKALDNNNDPVGYVVPKAMRERGPEWAVVNNIIEIGLDDTTQVSVTKFLATNKPYLYELQFRIDECEYTPDSGYRALSAINASILGGDVSFSNSDVGKTLTAIIKTFGIEGKNNQLHFYVGSNKLENYTTRNLKISILSLRPVGLLAEYLPQNLMESRKGPEVEPKANTFEFNIGSPYYMVAIGPQKYPYDCFYRVDYVVEEWDYQPNTFSTVGFLGIGGAKDVSGSKSWYSLEQAKVGELQSFLVKMPGTGNPALYIYGGNDNEVATARHLKVTIKGVTPVSIPSSWLDSAKQLPLSDEYTEPLFQSIGGYDMAANGAPEILYNE